MAKGRSTLILLAGILVLGAFIWIQETWRAKVPSKEARQVRLFDLDAGTLVSLQFQSSNLVVDCVKENGVWMTGDGGRGLGRADVALVQRMVAGLNSIGKGTTITAKQLEMRGMAAAEYGFDQPALQITAVDNKGSHSWLIGRETPLGDMLYAKMDEGEDIYTIPNSLLEVAPVQSDQFRDRTLFSGEVPGVRRLEIRGPGGFVQILKDPKSEWRIQQPVAAPADAKAVEDLLEKLSLLRIEDFVAENVSDFAVYGLQGETRQISLGGADGVSRMLVVGDDIAEQPGMVYARRADDTSVFAINTNALELLDIKLNDLRDARVLPLAVKDVSYISVARGDEQLELVWGEPGRWTIAKPVTWDADYTAVAKLLKLWDMAVITEFDVTNRTGTAKWTLLFGSDRLGQTNRIDILPALGKKDGLFVMRDGEPTVYQINLPLVPESILDPLGYKDRQLWQLRKEDVRKVSLEKNAQPRQVVEQLEDGTFAPAETNGTVRADAAAVGNLLDGLSSLSTGGYVAYNPSDLSVYGLAEPFMALHIGLAGTNQLGRVLLVGRETNQGFYAMVKGRDVVFTLGKPLVETLSADLVVGREQPVPSTE